MTDCLSTYPGLRYFQNFWRWVRAIFIHHNINFAWFSGQFKLRQSLWLRVSLVMDRYLDQLIVDIDEAARNLSWPFLPQDEQYIFDWRTASVV